MTTLIANLSTGKGTWVHVSKLIADNEWTDIILITNDFGVEKFSNEKPFKTIVINNRSPVKEMEETITKELKEKLKDYEVALNFVSGTGAEHMAILSAVMKTGAGFRIVTQTTEGMQIL